MPSFNAVSTMNLETCHADLIVLFNIVVLYYDCSVIDGYRVKAKQDLYYKTGASKSKYPDSKHNSIPSMAVDVVPYIPGKDCFNIRQCHDFGGYVKGVADMLHRDGIINHKIRHGGDWNMNRDVNDEKLRDLVHFELIKGG